MKLPLTGSVVAGVMEDVQSDPGGRFVTISRGQARVVFNGDTGESWNGA